MAIPKKIGVAFIVKVNVLPSPVAVGLGRAGAEMATLAGDGDAVEKARLLAAGGGFITPFW
jgi:hypothetical protein